MESREVIADEFQLVSINAISCYNVLDCWVLSEPQAELSRFCLQLKAAFELVTSAIL